MSHLRCGAASMTLCLHASARACMPLVKLACRLLHRRFNDVRQAGVGVEPDGRLRVMLVAADS